MGMNWIGQTTHVCLTHSNADVNTCQCVTFDTSSVVSGMHVVMRELLCHLTFPIVQRIVFSFSSSFSPVLLRSESNVFEFGRDFGWIAISFIAQLLNQLFTFIRFTVHWIKLNCFANNSLAFYIIRAKFRLLCVASKYWSPCVALPGEHEYGTWIPTRCSIQSLIEKAKEEEEEEEGSERDKKN